MSNTLSLVLKNNVAELERLSGQVNVFFEGKGVPPHAVYATHIALEEMITNVIKYGYADAGAHDIAVTLALSPNHLDIRIEDDGREFDPLSAPEPDIDKPLEERRIGGLGIHLTRTMVQDMRYQRLNGKNILDMRVSYQADHAPKAS